MQVRRRRTSGGQIPTVAVVVVVGAALLGIGVAWWLLRPSGADEVPMPVAAPAAVDSSGPDTASAPSVPLPALAESDGFVKDAVSVLSRHPGLASWMATDELVHRFVGAVVDVAGGTSPTENLDFLQPAGDFAVRESGSATLISEASFARYDTFVETMESIGTADLVRLYREFRPLFEEAFAELGIPNWTFQDTLDRAFENVLSVTPPTGPLRVEMDRTNYVFVDPELEQQSPLAKQLLRMGPDNLSRFQAKVREIRDGVLPR
ncbi:MAG: DUF3014 domain-containing protein [Gemmatimonadetes bacterium]|nr:DUF3014 domain-containing protein [Gemmatimonadota bacterium]